ncbi:hypothetical protein Droror1_Dr00010225 [Drosera rotundifolia]
MEKSVRIPWFLEVVERKTMSFDLMLKPMCRKCGRSNDLYGSNCKHMTLCLKCGKELAEARAKCLDYGVVLTRLIGVVLR